MVFHPPSNETRRAAAFTGHRLQSFPFTSEADPRCKAIKAALLTLIGEAYQDGLRDFRIGCALGADTWAGEAVLAFREKHDVRLLCAIPFPAWDAKWTPTERERMECILTAADECKTITDHYTQDAYRKRNYYLVDNSERLIAVYDHQGTNGRSGTAMTVNYARKQGRAVYFIHPGTAEITRPVL